MLSFDSEKTELFSALSDLMKSLDLILVEASSSQDKGDVNLRVILTKSEGEIDTEDLEKAYNVIYPIYQLKAGRDLNLEVSSPGLQRTFKSYFEFKVFLGRSVRIYSKTYSSYVVGTIKEADDESVTLSSYRIEDKNETGEEIKLEYNDISKAKLECIWEERKK